MSYACFEIIYGIPLVHPYKSLSDELEEIVECREHPLIQTRYSGHADQIPTFCGIPIGGFDECNPFLEMSALNFTPTQAQIDEFKDSFQKMPVDVQKMIRDYGGEPRVFILTCSS